MEYYYLINESSIKQINTNLVVLNRAARDVKSKGFEHEGEIISNYCKDIATLINTLEKCDVVPRGIFK
ncbi:hypothetical protein KKH23_05560 [Patescibacteria group bacterium]|nr:hypothetical protein [Patescibacteria group bacterium]MBU0846638.1 hypothetical protein [Patescibacteria group bacterium]